VLLKERLDKITHIVNERGSVTNHELMTLLNVSESTIRRDVTMLAADNKIIRSHGGAVSLGNAETYTKDRDVSDRRSQNREKKIRIGKAAASLIKDNDLVYIDAGTTTEYMIDYITAFGATFVTNAVAHAVKMAKRGLSVFIIGGQIKSVTEAIIDSEAIVSLSKYNFTKGFFGSNGISEEEGFTTPDICEAGVKSFAMNKCALKYVLCDSGKFGKLSRITFEGPEGVTVITDKKPEGFENYNIMEA
jgi:DeoR family fructose operon transcriptional repressor